MWESDAMRWFYWLFCRFFTVENLLRFLGQNVDKYGTFFAERQFCVANAKNRIFCHFCAFPQNPVENVNSPEFSLSVTNSCRLYSRFIAFSTSNEKHTKPSKINAPMSFQLSKSTCLSTRFEHCGKIVDKWEIFPQIHNLFTLPRHKCVKMGS